jgi:hypothetical protein
LFLLATPQVTQKKPIPPVSPGLWGKPKLEPEAYGAPVFAGDPPSCSRQRHGRPDPSFYRPSNSYTLCPPTSSSLFRLLLFFSSSAASPAAATPASVLYRSEILYSVHALATKHGCRTYQPYAPPPDWCPVCVLSLLPRSLSIFHLFHVSCLPRLYLSALKTSSAS